jgi:hypothetical protein
LKVAGEEVFQGRDQVMADKRFFLALEYMADSQKGDHYFRVLTQIHEVVMISTKNPFFSK